MASNDRRGFLQGMLSAGAMAAAAPVGAAAQAPSPARPGGEFPFLPQYARAQNYKSLKQSSYDRTGGNSERESLAHSSPRRP